MKLTISAVLRPFTAAITETLCPFAVGASAAIDHKGLTTCEGVTQCGARDEDTFVSRTARPVSE